MVDKPSLVNQLLDAIEGLLIENRAYLATIKRLSPEAQQMAHRLIAMAKNDLELRKVIRGKFAGFRDLSPEEALQEILKKLGTKDVN